MKVSYGAFTAFILTLPAYAPALADDMTPAPDSMGASADEPGGNAITSAVEKTEPDLHGTAAGDTLRARLLEAANTNKPMTVIPLAGVGPIRFGMSAQAVETTIGKPLRVTGRANEFQHLGLAVVLDEEDRVAALFVGAWCETSDILLDVFKGETEEGIHLRAAREEILKAYGEPSAAKMIGPSGAEFELLKYDALHVDFALRKGKLVHITLRRPKPK